MEKKASSLSIEKLHSCSLFEKYFERIQEIILFSYKRLIDLDMALILFFRECLGITTTLLFSSDIPSPGKGTERLVNICKELKASEYLSGDAGMNYIDGKIFEDNGIGLRFHNYQHPEYSQIYSPFIPYLSIVDLLFNHGENSFSIITA